MSNVIEQDRLEETAQAVADPDVDILSGILAASTDACWCVEFDEPVDLSAPEAEIVRQVFENGPRWRFTNAAMARLYLLEDGVAFESRPTWEIFPRNAQNEAFVADLIANGFEIDAAPALDTRYDGEQIYVENDVRAHVANGRLLRMFGIVRDVGKHRRREDRAQADLDEARDILSALPQPVLAFDARGRVRAANLAAEKAVGSGLDDLLGRDLRDLDLPAPVCRIVERALDLGLPDGATHGGTAWMVAPRAQGGAVLTQCSGAGEGAPDP